MFSCDTCERSFPLSSITTLGIGGSANLFFRATTKDELLLALEWARLSGISHLVIGRGSNCLFSDSGFPGLVIQNSVKGVSEHGGGRYTLQAGESFSSFAMAAAKAGWGGLEFAPGIPGSFGGAIYMNAGASGQQVGDVVHSVECLDSRGAVRTFSSEEMIFGYRTSLFSASDYVVTAVTVQLTADASALSKTVELLRRRKNSQPYNERSAGCVFKNPPGGSAGRLIDECGLKGFRIGGAEISTVHANFIVNKGGGRAQDVLEIIRHARAVVLDQKHVALECEVKILGEQWAR